MARPLPGTTIDMARGAIASLNCTDPAAIADYLIASVTARGDVRVHTSLCCVRHALLLLESVEFGADQCEMTGERR